MGVKDLLQYAPTKDPQVYSSGPIDWWNQVGPRSMQIGETTDIGGKRYSNMNKNFNTDTIEELQNRFSDTTKETPDSTDPYFYKLKNKDTGEIKFGLAPLGLDERYAGQDISNWDVVYNKRRSDAVDLEAQIHGNENFLKRRVVDYGLSKNKFGKGATEIYSEALTGAVANLDLKQTSILDKVLEGAKKAGEGMQIASGYKDELGNDSPEGRSKRMTKTLRDLPLDTGKGIGIGIAKAVGGLASLLGNEDIKKEMQGVARVASESISSKNNVASVIGELLPELTIPAIGPISKGASLAKRVTQGAGSGAVLTGGYEALKEQSDIKEGMDTNVEVATGIGAVLGGIVGGITKNPTLGNTVGKAFETGDSKIQEEILQTYPEARGQLQEYVKNQQTKPAQEQRSHAETVGKPELQEVKPRTSISKESKETGQKVKESEGMQKMGAVEFDVVRATEPAEATITKRPYTTNVQTGKTQGRVYYEKQGLAKDISNKTKFKTREPEEIVDAESHVNRKLKMFDDDVEVRKAYGSPEAKFKKEDTTTPEQYQADRLQYEKDLYKDLIKTKTGEVKEQAKQKLKELKTKKVTTKVFSEEDIAKAQETVEKQVGITKEKPDVKVERQAEESRIYEHFKANDKDYQEGFGFAKKEIPDAEIYKNILNRAIERKSEVSQAKVRIDKLKSLGNKPNPNDEYIVRHQAELRSDITSYKNKEIDIDELRFRELRRLEDSIKKNKDSKFEDRIQILEQEAKRVEDYRQLGIKKTGRAIVGDKQLGTGEYKPKEYNQKDDSSRIFTESVANKYRETNRVNRTKQGEMTLREDQINLLDEGITPEQLGRMASSNDEVKAIAKKEVTEQINKARRESIGISKNMEPKGHYVFKDEMADATAQSVQIKALLLGNKRLAEGSNLMKPVSKDMIESKGDFRNLVAKEMKLDKSIISKIEKKTGEAWGKPHIKVMSTPSGYGQGLQGRTRKLIEEFGLTRREADTVAKEYERVMDNIFPEDAMLNKIFKQLEQQGTGEFEWTLPSGNKSRISVKGTATGKIGKDKVEITINKPDKAFRGLLAGVVQSIDGYIATTIAKRLDIPLTTVHDAFRTKAGNFDKIMNEYNKISTEILDSDLLHNIMKELGYKGENLKNMSEALTKEEVLSGIKKLSPEHTEGELIPVLKRELDDSKIKTENELMRDFMASMDYRTNKTSSMLDSMVDDQMYSDIITKQSDSPFENAIYNAMQGSTFTKEMHMEVPDGVNKRLFRTVEKELFAEARMKLEYNPLLREDVKGARKYFDENREPIGRKVQTVNEILRTETKLAESKSIDNFQQRKEKVFKWKENKVLTKKEYIEKKAVMDTVLEVGSPKLKYKTTWNMQNSDAEIYRKARELQTIRDFAKSTVDRNAESLNRALEKIEPNKLKEIRTLIKSDYEPIMGITKEQVKKIKQEALKLPKGIDRHIEASAKGLWSEANQYGYYARNATELARRFKLDESSIPLLDQLISIKAMDLNDGWKIVEKLKDDKDLDFVLKAMKHKRVMSENDIFINNPEKIIKGYQEEVYRGQKELSEAGSVQYRTGPQYEEGLLGKELENKKIGTLYEDEVPVFSKPQDKFDWMQKNRLRETNGTFRQVTGEDIRKELGKVYDFRESFVETMRATEQKIANKQITMYVMIESDKGSLLFSKEAKEGFIALNEKQMNHLPYEMRDSVKFVNKEMFEPIMGREEIRLYNGTNRSLQMIDRLANNFAVLFKQDNVLKNPVSYINSFIVNQTLPMAMGINPAKHVKHQADGLKFLKEMNEVTDKLYAQKVTGQKLDAILEKRLKDNPLYQMEKKGLSTNRVEGTLGDEDLLGAILKDKMPSMVYSLARHLNLSQKTPVGRETIKAFSKIDTTGRYAMVASLMDKGLTMDKAILESNGLYSNMDEMAVSVIELLDKYPLVPFIKWFSKTSPKLLQVTKNNPIKSVVTAIGLYILAQELNRNLSTTNPLEAMIDFAEGQTPFATYDKIEATGMGDVLMKSLRSHTVPKYLVNAWESPETLGVEKLLKPRIEYEPYKGFVQSTIDKKGEE